MGNVAATLSRVQLGPFGRVLAAGLLALLPGLAAADAAVARPAGVEQLAETFHQLFSEVMVEEEIPGAAFALVHQGRLLRIGTHGEVRRGSEQPVGVGTVFRIASVSKGFAGTLAALLAAEGRFGWEDPVVRHVPEFRFQGDVRALRVIDVVGQRTGFVPNAYDNLIEAGLARDEILGRFADLEPICPPGECYTYQNSLFSLIEPVIETATGLPYPELVEVRLFQPLGMRSASLGYEAFRSSPDRADPHLRVRGGWRAVSPRSTYYQVGSAAGVNASILDMAQWSLAMLGHRPDVLPETIVAQITRPGLRTLRDLRRRAWRAHLDDAHYALGWRVYRLPGHELIYHGGWVAGFRAEIGLSPAHDLGLVILINAESRVIAELMRDFWTELVPEAAPAPGATVLTTASPL